MVREFGTEYYKDGMKATRGSGISDSLSTLMVREEDYVTSDATVG